MSKEKTIKERNTTWSGAVVRSVLFHIVVIFVAVIGLPHATKDPINISPPITVELIDIAELTQTNKLSSPVKPKKEKKPDKKKPPESKPTPPKVDSPTPPDLSEPKAPDLEKDVATSDPFLTPEALKKIIEKPRPPKKKPKPPKKKKPKKAANDFQSLLKNLTPDAKKEDKVDPNDNKTDSSQKSQIAKIADRMSISETDAFLQQLGQCWSLMSGAKFAENLVVPIKIIVNPDRTVNRASIVDKGRYNRDSHYRAAADAAVRALRHPRCTPLRLPPDKYEEWKIITINFDPRDML